MPSCQNVSHHWVTDENGNQLHVTTLCKCWDCPHCNAARKNEQAVHICGRFRDRDGPIFRFTCPESGWRRIRAKIRHAGGHYYAITQTDGTLIVYASVAVTAKALRDGQWLTAQEAAQSVSEDIMAIPVLSARKSFNKNWIRASNAWRLPEKPPDTLGKWRLTHATTDDVHKACREHGTEPVVKRGPSRTLVRLGTDDAELAEKIVRSAERRAVRRFVDVRRAEIFLQGRDLSGLREDGSPNRRQTENSGVPAESRHPSV